MYAEPWTFWNLSLPSWSPTSVRPTGSNRHFPPISTDVAGYGMGR